MCGQNHLSHFQAEYQPGSGVALPAFEFELSRCEWRGFLNHSINIARWGFQVNRGNRTKGVGKPPSPVVLKVLETGPSIFDPDDCLYNICLSSFF